MTAQIPHFKQQSFFLKFASTIILSGVLLFSPKALGSTLEDLERDVIEGNGSLPAGAVVDNRKEPVNIEVIPYLGTSYIRFPDLNIFQEGFQRNVIINAKNALDLASVTEMNNRVNADNSENEEDAKVYLSSNNLLNKKVLALGKLINEIETMISEGASETAVLFQLLKIDHLRKHLNGQIDL